MLAFLVACFVLLFDVPSAAVLKQANFERFLACGCMPFWLLVICTSCCVQVEAAAIQLRQDVHQDAMIQLRPDD